jgi:hypothetical protein
MLVTDDPDGDSDADRVQLTSWRRNVPLVLRDAGDEYNVSKERDWIGPRIRNSSQPTQAGSAAARPDFHARGDGFSEVKLPELPNLPDEPSPAIAKQNKEGFPARSRSATSLLSGG